MLSSYAPVNGESAREHSADDLLFNLITSGHRSEGVYD